MAADNGRMSVNLGLPALPPPVLAPRRASRQVLLRHSTHPVAVGGDAPISVQSMATTLASAGWRVAMLSGASAVGGGSAPGVTLPTVLLSLARMNRIRAVSPADNTMIAEAGVVLATLPVGSVVAPPAVQVSGAVWVRASQVSTSAAVKPGKTSTPSASACSPSHLVSAPRLIT